MFALLFAVGCEDLEDTYDEFAGDGMRRYLGRCGDVEVAAGWERLRVVWKNNLDVGVENTRITWKSENDAEPFVRHVKRPDVLDKNDLMDTVYLEGLSDATYEITVCNVAADSTTSLVTTLYARPYTTEHEDLRTFTRGITNFYVLEDRNGNAANNRLAVILDEDNENLIDLTLNFWGTDGQQHSWDIKEHMMDSVSISNFFGTMNLMRDYMKLLPEDGAGYGIDFSDPVNKPITVSRQGILTGCIDDVPFADDTLSLDERVFSVAFTQWLTKNYGPDWESKLETIETAELDYSMNTFQDLLYLPNLREVVLGKNRFMEEGQQNTNLSTTDDYIGLMTLQFLKETRGVTTVRYNNQYFNSIVSGAMMTYQRILEMFMYIDRGLITNYSNGENMALMPTYTALDSDGWEVTCSDTAHSGDKENGAAWLLDNDPSTYFEPTQTLGVSVIEVEIDMGEAQVIHGFKVSQPASSTATNVAYLLSSIEIEVSEDGYNYEPATYEDAGITIGNTVGEITFIKVPEELQKPVRYLRFTMANRQTGSITDEAGTTMPTYSLRLADVVPY